MKELWTANQFHLMNRPFTEMGYNSSGLNIVPERLLLATRRPSMHHPLASGAPSFDPLRTTRRRATNHATHGTTSGDPPCKPSAVVLRSIWRPPTQHPPSRRKPSTRQFTARYPPAHRKPSAVVLHNIWRPPTSHPSSHGTASFDPRASSAGTLQASVGTNRCP